MSDYLSLNHGIECRQINIKELNHETFQVDEPLVALWPTYLGRWKWRGQWRCRNLTNPLGDFTGPMITTNVAFIIGSGNRNFNNQYCLNRQTIRVIVLASLCWETLNFVAHSLDIERLAPIILGRIKEL